MAAFKAQAHVKTNCPFSFKFRLFVTEAGLEDHVAFNVLDVLAPGHGADKAALRDRIGHAHTFPVVEIAPGEFMDDSDALIAYFAKAHGIDTAKLATLAFYRDGLFPTFLEMFRILAAPLGWIARMGRKPRAFR